jgi:hypothetical protein
MKTHLSGGRLRLRDPPGKSRAVAGDQRAYLSLMWCLEDETLVVALWHQLHQVDCDKTVAWVEEDGLDVRVSVLVQHKLVVRLDHQQTLAVDTKNQVVS